MKFELKIVVTSEELLKILELAAADTELAIRALPGVQADAPVEAKPAKAPIKRRSKVQEAIIEMLADGPLTTAQIRAGLGRFNLSPASTSALTPMRSEGRIVDAGDGKWALAA